MNLLRSSLLLAIACLASAAAREPHAKARASLQAPAEPWVGESLTLVVELLAPGYFAGTPAFDLPRVPGVLIVPPAGSPVISTEQAGDVSFTVQRHELRVIAQHEGESTVPAFEVRLGFKRNPLDHDPVEEAVKTTAVSFKALRPPGSHPGELLITSRDLKVEESWQPVPGTTAKAGDAFVRTFTWSASDLPGMAFPPFVASPLEGLGIYPGDPVVSDESNHGDFQGGRTDTVTYVCKTGGHLVIPALTVRWWDPAAKEMKHADFQARAFDVPVPPAPPVSLKVKLQRVWREHGTAFVTIATLSIALGLALYFSKDALIRSARRLLPRHLPPLNPGQSSRSSK